jgi:hypothetical protein
MDVVQGAQDGVAIAGHQRRTPLSRVASVPGDFVEKSKS